MIKLIRSEFFKLRKSIYPWVIAGILFVPNIVMFIIYALNHNKPEKMMGLFQAEKITGFENLLSDMGTIVYILVGVFMAIFLSNEFSTGSIRQIFSKGSSRVKFALAKLITGSLFMLGALIVYYIFAFCTAAVFFGSGYSLENLKETGMLLLGTVIYVTAFSAFCLFTASIFRKNGFVVAVNILTISIGELAYNLIISLFKKYELLAYWPMYMSRSFGMNDVSYEKQFEYMGLFMILLIIFTLLGTYIIKKRDV